MAYIRKKHIPRETGIPLEFPLKCYQPADNDIPPCSPEILVGMDSGISNTAFAYMELIRDEITNAVIDFKYGGTYYFKDELDDFSYKIDKQIYLASRYYDLFSHRNVSNLTFEVLSLNSSKNEEMKLPAASCGVSARDSLRSSLVCCAASCGELNPLFD